MPNQLLKEFRSIFEKIYIKDANTTWKSYFGKNIQNHHIQHYSFSLTVKQLCIGKKYSCNCQSESTVGAA
jgi:hypothetical protein